MTNPKLLPNFQKVQEAINNASSILLTTHERTDGDDLGTVLALSDYLKRLDKKFSVVISGGVPPALRFLPGSELVEEGLTSRDFDLLIVSGCSVKNRIGNEKIENLSVKTINLDHHPDNTNFADINIVDHTKSSVAELAYDLFLSCGWKLTPEVSTCLLTGIFTDTGSFMHSNTVSSTFSAAADLLKHGARLTTIAKKTFQGKNLEVLKAWGKALENAYFDEKKQIIYSVVTDPDLKNLGELPAAAFDGLVETLNKVPQAKFALFLRQEGNVIKGSLRSDPHKGVDVSQIAHVFGGGGHKWASGFSIVGKLTKDLSGNWQVVS